MQRPLCTGALLAAAIACAACGEDHEPYFGSTVRSAGKDPATLYVNNSSEPEYLDPGRCTDGGCGALIQQLFEGLTSYDPKDAHPVQGVATHWEQSADNRLFRFHLRPDARWSDGKQVTAFDFEYAWRRVLKPATASRAAAHLYALKNGEAYNQGKIKATRAEIALATEPRAGAPEGARLPAGTAVLLVEKREKAAAPGDWLLVERFTELPTFRPDPAPALVKERGYLRAAELVDDDAVIGVRATDAVTLEVELQEPTPYLLDLTSHHTLMPVRRDLVEAFEKRGEGELWVRPENMIGNGAYSLDRWRFQYEITMKQNPYYWNRDQLKIKRIVWLEVEEYHATMNLYKAAEIDYIGDNLALPPEYNTALAGKKDYLRNDFLSIYWFELNTRKPPLDDVRVRRALNLAIDKQQVVDKVARAGQRPATHFVPDFTGLGYADQARADKAAGQDPFKGPGMDFDPERARALLKEAGFAVQTDGEGYRADKFPPLEILYNTSEGHRQIAIAIQAMWKNNLGISATLRNEEWKVMLKNYRDGNFQVMRFGQAADFNHAHTFLEPFLGKNPHNETGWQDAAFDDALHAAAATADPKLSIQRYRKAEQLAVAGMARIPLYFYTRSVMVKPWLKGFWGSSRNAHSVQYLWLDPDHWRTSPNVPAYPPPELPAPGPWTRSPG